MVNLQIQQELQRQMERLSDDQQRQVVDFARSLKKPRPKGVSPESLRKYIGSIPIDDLERMKAAIEADCERIEVDAD